MRQLSIFLALLLPVSLLVSTVQAQGASLSDLPPCARQCLVQSLNATKCSLVDMPCLCADEHFQDTVTLCVLHGCTVKEGLVAKNTTSTLCHVPPRDRSGTLKSIYIVFGGVTALTVLVRLAFKSLVMRMAWTLDDWSILATGIVVSSSVAIGVHGGIGNGLGRDIWTLTPVQITTFAKYFYAMEIVYIIELTLLKLSMLFFYLRIFPAAGARRVLWLTVAFNILVAVVFVFLAIFQCRPISYTWTGWDGEHKGSCTTVNPLAWAHAAVSIAVDFWMLAIPLWQLRSLKLHWKKKIGVGLMFFVGTFVTIVSILRLQSLVTFSNSSNPTWDDWETTNWSTIEVNVGIICATLPTARLMLKRIFPALGGTSQNTKGYYYGKDHDGDLGGKWPGQRSVTRSAVTAGGTVDDTAARKGGIIVHHQTFTVQYAREEDSQYGEPDEERLVRMRDLDGRGRGTEAASEVRSHRSDRSEISL